MVSALCFLAVCIRTVSTYCKGFGSMPLFLNILHSWRIAIALVTFASIQQLSHFPVLSKKDFIFKDMCVCVCVWVCVCVYTYACLFMFICVCACVFVLLSVCFCVYIFICEYVV